MVNLRLLILSITGLALAACSEEHSSCALGGNQYRVLLYGEPEINYAFLIDNTNKAMAYDISRDSDLSLRLYRAYQRGVGIRLGAEFDVCASIHELQPSVQNAEYANVLRIYSGRIVREYDMTDIINNYLERNDLIPPPLPRETQSEPQQ
jgi:hypothetical protein